MIILKGMTWDHVRGIAPVKAAADEFARNNPGISIEWKARSLKDFEDFPVDVLAREYDLMMIDHPFTGEGVSKGIFEAVDGWIPETFLNDQIENSVGPGHATYTWQGKQWALAADVAAQTAAFRPDILPSPLPRDWDDVFALARALPAGQNIGLPLVATHAYSSFITLNANIGGPDFWQNHTRLHEDTALEALDVLSRLAEISDPRSLHMNPIHMLDVMSSEISIVYAPLIYGYSNYARSGYAKYLVRFSDIPSHVEEPRGSQIGGVGIAVSACSQHKKIAMAFAQYLVSPEIQTGLYYFSGGQPGHRKAWMDQAINDDCHGFFRDTIKTLDLSYVRPRKPNYNRFQEAAGEEIHRYLRDGGNARQLIKTFDALFEKIVLRP